MEDQQIIALYFQRQEQAIQETDRKYGRLCHGIAVNVLSDRQDSEECVNDTYLAVWHQIPTTRPMSFRAFLCGITRNLALKKLEWRQAAKRRCPGTVSLEELENLLPDERFAPDASGEEIGACINAFLAQEPKEARQGFLRRYWYFDSVADIARRYGFTQSKVKSMLLRSRNRLREYLEQEGVWL